MLAADGHVAEHVADVGLLSASDSEIWGYALAHDAVLITKDEDSPDQVLVRHPAPVIVWIRVGNTSVEPCSTGSPLSSIGWSR